MGSPWYLPHLVRDDRIPMRGEHDDRELDVPPRFDHLDYQLSLLLNQNQGLLFSGTMLLLLLFIWIKRQLPDLGPIRNFIYSFIHYKHLYSASSSGATQRRSQPQHDQIEPL